MAVRLDDAIESRLDVLAKRMSERAHGAEVTKSNVLRVAIERGLEALEHDLGVARKTKH